MSQPDMDLLRSDKAVVCRREINCDQGGAIVYCVVLADGFIVECGTGVGESRAKRLADAVNAYGADLFSLKNLYGVT